MPPSKKSRTTHNPSYYSRQSGSAYVHPLKRLIAWLITLPIVAAGLFFLLSGGSMDVDRFKENASKLPQAFSNVVGSRSDDSESPKSTSNAKKDIFVSEIGRTCKWDSEYESYYDEPTDCYFWKNDTINPVQWQYWYEDISSDYGDYGWMEYDFDENRWYIEVSDGDWIRLPNRYDTTDLWHLSRSS